MRETPFLRHELPMPPQQRIGAHYRVEFHQSLAPDGPGLPPQKSAFCIGEPNALPTQPFLQELVLGLQKFDDDTLMALHLARHDHEQKRQ